MKEDTRVELTEERVREIVREELAKMMVEESYTSFYEEQVRIMESMSE